MPNYVQIDFVVKGEAAAVEAFAVGVHALEGSGEDGAEDGRSCFDFSRLAPMPQELNVTEGSDSELGKALLTGTAESYLKYAWVKDAGITNVEELLAWTQVNRPDAIELGQKHLDNLEKFGVASWYEWNIANWGTKWNACGPKVERLEGGALKYHFDTAWSFPEPIFKLVAERFPGITIEGTVDEEGGFFYGSFTVQEGQVHLDFQEGTRKGGPYDYSEGDDDEEGEDATDSSPTVN